MLFSVCIFVIDLSIGKAIIFMYYPSIFFLTTIFKIFKVFSVTVNVLDISKVPAIILKIGIVCYRQSAKSLNCPLYYILNHCSVPSLLLKITVVCPFTVKVLNISNVQASTLKIAEVCPVTVNAEFFKCSSFQT